MTSATARANAKERQEHEAKRNERDAEWLELLKRNAPREEYRKSGRPEHELVAFFYLHASD